VVTSYQKYLIHQLREQPRFRERAYSFTSGARREENQQAFARGRWWIDANEHGVTGLRLERRGRASSAHGPERCGARAAKELRAYFAGRLTAFSVPCDISALPFFTQTVSDSSQKFLTVRLVVIDGLQNPETQRLRAVGNALARNPLPIIIPCHVVVRGSEHRPFCAWFRGKRNY
jgi:methylated-DNA-[protein]-cysteine S-methyltransferase